MAWDKRNGARCTDAMRGASGANATAAMITGYVTAFTMKHTEGPNTLRVMAPSTGPTDRATASPASFSVGDCVRTCQFQADHHTRLPAYARGKVGCIAAVRAVHVYPDTNAHGLGEQPQWLYSVAFEGTTLWGQEADPGLTVYVDAWEPYLERVQ